jgi:hypothetical protein
MQRCSRPLGILMTVVSFVALATLGCSKSSSAPSAASTGDPPAPKPLAFRNENRVVLSPSEKGDWAITLPDAADADSQLAAFLQTSRDPSIAPKLATPFYYGQYYGVTDRNGEHVIHANFFCQHHIDEMQQFSKTNPKINVDDWKVNPVRVNDGGHCYFNVNYNPKSRTFEELLLNGDG